MTSGPLPILGANAGRSRGHNRQLVLGHVRRAGRIGRAEIARSSGLSTQAVSNIIAELQEDGLLVEQGRLSAGRGLPAVQYAVNPKGGVALGVEIRPDVVFCALLDLAGQEIFSQRRPLPDPDPEVVADLVGDLRDAALASADVPATRCLGAGVVLPGPFGTTGLSTEGAELPGWQHLDVASWLTARLNIPVLVENDANAAAMAEHVSGAARGINNFAFLYFGAGLGMGIVLDGKLIRGAHGNAGEIGHTFVPDSSGQAVMLEDAVSRLSVQKHLRRAGLSADSVDALSTLYHQDLPELHSWLASAGPPLSHAITMIENLFDPQTVILGGAMPDEIIDDLIGRVQLSERSVANRADRSGPRLLRGGTGRMTATRGAAALVINQTFTPQIAAIP